MRIVYIYCGDESPDSGPYNLPKLAKGNYDVLLHSVLPILAEELRGVHMEVTHYFDSLRDGKVLLPLIVTMGIHLTPEAFCHPRQMPEDIVATRLDLGKLRARRGFKDVNHLFAYVQTVKECLDRQQISADMGGLVIWYRNMHALHSLVFHSTARSDIAQLARESINAHSEAAFHVWIANV